MTRIIIALLSVVLVAAAAAAIWVFLSFGQPFGKHALDTQVDRSLKVVKTSGKLRICTDASALPWALYDPTTQQYSGGEVEIGKLLSQEMGLQAEFVNKNRRYLLEALTSRQCDVVISALTNSSNSPEINFSNLYLQSGLSLLVRRSDAGKINGLNDLKGKNVGVLADSDAAQLAGSISGVKSVKTYGYDADVNFYDDLQHGLVDAVIYDQLNNLYYARTHATQVSCLCAPSQLLTHTNYVAAVRVDDHALLGAINSGIGTFATASSGSYYQAYRDILRKWYGSQ